MKVCSLCYVFDAHEDQGTGTLIDWLYKDYAQKLGHLSFVLIFPIWNSPKIALKCSIRESLVICVAV